MIKNIAFDVGGVLLKVAKIEDMRQGIVDFLKSEIGVREEEGKIRRIVDEIVPQWFSERGLGENLWSKYFSPEISAKIVGEYKYYHDKKYIPISKMVDLCKRLSKKYELGILSNFSNDLIVRDSFFEMKIFKTVVFSGTFGVAKPDQEIYKIYCEKAGYKAEEVLFIDDREENVKGAIRFGMKGLLFENQEKLEKDMKEAEIIE